MLIHATESVKRGSQVTRLLCGFAVLRPLARNRQSSARTFARTAKTQGSFRGPAPTRRGSPQSSSQLVAHHKASLERLAPGSKRPERIPSGVVDKNVSRGL